MRSVEQRIAGCGLSSEQENVMGTWGPRQRDAVVPKNCAVVIRLRPEQYLAIASAAGQEDRSMSSFVRRVVERALTAGDARQGDTPNAA
jgi:hypothetical protein